MLGIVSAVSVDSHNHVFVFDRRDRVWPRSDTLDTTPIEGATVRVFDGRTGVRLAEWGAKAFALPNGITIDASDNAWLTDVALHQVYKYSHDGALLLTVGERGVPGEDSLHFNRPSGVVAAPDGSFYVSDGYGNNRVMAFAPDGRFLFQWGVKGQGPGQFDLRSRCRWETSPKVRPYQTTAIPPDETIISPVLSGLHWIPGSHGDSAAKRRAGYYSGSHAGESYALLHI